MTAPYYADDAVTLYHGSCLDILRELPDASVDAVVTDPPYGLANTSPAQVTQALTAWVTGDREFLPGGAGFMGKAWDAFVPPVAVWDECYRVLKPGGHVLAFAGARTGDLMGLALRLAGFDIRDSIAWLYGSGFPKSLDVSKAIDKMDAGEERLARARTFQSWLRQHVTPQQVNEVTGTDMGHHLTTHPTQPSVATAPLFDLLRPLLPPVPDEIERLVEQRTVESQNFKARAVVGTARMVDTTKSRLGFAGETYGGTGADRDVDLTMAHTPEAARWQGWGTALKPAFEPIVVGRKPLGRSTVAANVLAHGTGALNIDATRVATSDDLTPAGGERVTGNEVYGKGLGVSSGRSAEMGGRWPTNVVLDESQAAELDKQSGDRPGMKPGVLRRGATTGASIGGGAAYGTAAPQEVETGYADSGGASRFFPTFRYEAKAPTHERPRDGLVAHPTVKPLDLMRWLVRLVTPPGGTVLEPFAGSGTTAEACVVEGFRCIAIEREADYLPLIVSRLTKPLEVTLDFGDFS